MMQSFPFTSQITYDADGNIEYDRAVDSIIFRNVLRQYVTNGVFPNPSTNFHTIANPETDMTVIVEVGSCIINGATAYEVEDRELTVQAADTKDRIDTVVLRLNDQLEYRNIDLYIVKGEPATTPVAPTLTRTQDIYELGIANLFIPANSTRITQERITDTRLDTERCGYAMFMSKIDTTALYTQIQADLLAFRTNEQADFSDWRSGQEQTFSDWKSTQESTFEIWEQAQKDDFETWEGVTKKDVEDWFADLNVLVNQNDAVRLTNEVETLKTRVGNIETGYVIGAGLELRVEDGNAVLIYDDGTD